MTPVVTHKFRDSYQGQHHKFICLCPIYLWKHSSH